MKAGFAKQDITNILTAPLSHFKDGNYIPLWQSYAFYFLSISQALSKLHEIEVQLNSRDLPQNSAELADRHLQLSNVIVEVSMSAQTEGRLLLERVSGDDRGADGVRHRVSIGAIGVRGSILGATFCNFSFNSHI